MIGHSGLSLNKGFWACLGGLTTTASIPKRPEFFLQNRAPQFSDSPQSNNS